ncbi:MAG: hypothetical protein HA496_08805 [Thaumarchaeota archaeon]|nr:hypothetical protein [Nitrososphaerota archaeon]
MKEGTTARRLTVPDIDKCVGCQLYMFKKVRRGMVLQVSHKRSIRLLTGYASSHPHA